MNRLHIPTVLAWLVVVCCVAAPTFAQPVEKTRIDIVAVDPGLRTTLGKNEKLYVKVHYETAIPLRFQAIAMREGVPLEVGAIKNPPALHAPGTGEALAWVMYTNPTHIDAVRIMVLDEQWQAVQQLSQAADVTWQGITATEPRVTADWVAPMIRTERRQIDYVYDPSPRKYGVFYDLFFFLNVITIPAYILLQLHMLWRYRYRWRELAVIPLFPYVIVGFYLIAGLNIETALLVTFLFRYTPCALAWLALLWLAKRFWQHKLPPPKLYKPPKA